MGLMSSEPDIVGRVDLVDNVIDEIFVIRHG
jgi:hypothetical protein